MASATGVPERVEMLPRRTVVRSSRTLHWHCCHRTDLNPPARSPHLGQRAHQASDPLLRPSPGAIPRHPDARPRFHASLNLLAFLFLVTGVTIIEYNKLISNGAHFHSVHGYLGVISSFVLLAQYFVGFTIWATPRLYGSVDNAKSIYKYHRWSGYLILTLLLATVVAAIDTPFNYNVLKIPLWAVLLLAILILVGVYPRIQKQKLGFKTAVVS
ncbi:hypothetical protein V2G26_016068 [Clonostachys chloroleuca]